MWEAYSHEVSSCGYWPGPRRARASSTPTPTPSRPATATSPVAPAGARWDDGLGEFVLPYELVRTAADPDAVLLEFLQSTYEAAATAADWDRAAPGATERRLGRGSALREPRSVAGMVRPDGERLGRAGARASGTTR